jgi:hypothetical protein
MIISNPVPQEQKSCAVRELGRGTNRKASGEGKRARKALFVVSIFVGSPLALRLFALAPSPQWDTLERPILEFEKNHGKRMAL